MKSDGVIDRVMNQAWGAEVCDPDAGYFSGIDVHETDYQNLNNVRFKARGLGKIIQIDYKKVVDINIPRNIDKLLLDKFNKLDGKRNIMWLWGPPKSGKTFTAIRLARKLSKELIPYLYIKDFTPPESLVALISEKFKDSDIIIIDNAQNLYAIDYRLMQEISRLCRRAIFITRNIHKLESDEKTVSIRIDEPTRLDNIPMVKRNRYLWYQETFEDFGPWMRELIEMLEDIFSGHRYESNSVDDYIRGSCYSGGLVKFILNGNALYVSSWDDIHLYFSHYKSNKKLLDILRVIMSYADLTQPEDRIIVINNGSCNLKTYLDCERINIIIDSETTAESLKERMLKYEEESNERTIST